MSVGIRHPYQATVEAVRVLAAADVIYNNVPDPQISEFLSLFPGKVVAVPRRMDKTSDEDRANWILDQVDPAKVSAFLTRIHPFIYRRIGYDLARLSRERGLAFQAYGAVSLTELAPALAGRAASTLQVLDIGHLTSEPGLLDSSKPALIYCIGTDKRPELSRLIASRYGAKHPVWILGGAGDREDSVTKISVGGLARVLDDADGGTVVYLPQGARR